MKTREEAPLQALARYLPDGSAESVLAYIVEYRVHLTITRERLSVLGDYRHPDRREGHRISINGNLNPYAFLLTLVHEIAHMLTYVQHGSRVAPHGAQWKATYARLLGQYAGKGYLPLDVEEAVRRSMLNPAASSCSDEDLMRILRRYDLPKDGHCLVEELVDGALFRTRDGRIFRRGAKKRKRFECTDVQTRETYLFSPIYEVQRLPSSQL